MRNNKIFRLTILWLVSVVIWSLYRYFFRTTPELFEELFLKPIVFVGLTLWFLSQNGHITAGSMGFRGENKKQIILWGGGFGLFLVLESIIVEVLIKRGQFILPNNLLSIIILLTIPIATAISEEILYRGLIMEQLWQQLNNEWTANLISTLLFIISHIAQGIFMLHYGDAELLKYFLLMGILGFADGFIYQQTRSIYATVIFHSAWNFSNVVIS